MNQRTAHREQLILRHSLDSDGDWLIEAGGNSHRRWYSSVEQRTLTLGSVKAFLGQTPPPREMLGGADTGVSECSPYPLTLSGVSQQDRGGVAVYGIDVSQADPDKLIAKRIDESIGVDLISRAPEAFDVAGLKIPYGSEVFVSTDGWPYGDAESVQLLFDVPEADLRELFGVLAGGSVASLDLRVSLQIWLPSQEKTGVSDVNILNVPVIYGYGGHARLTDWTVTARVT